MQACFGDIRDRKRGNRCIGNIRASRKRTVIDACNRIGNRHRGQACAILESIGGDAIAFPLNVVRKHKLGCRTGVAKQYPFPFFHDKQQTIICTKDAARLVGIGMEHQRIVCHVAILSRASGERKLRHVPHLDQINTVIEGVVPNARDRRRDPRRDKALTAIEGKRPDLGYALGDHEVGQRVTAEIEILCVAHRIGTNTLKFNRQPSGKRVCIHGSKRLAKCKGVVSNERDRCRNRNLGQGRAALEGLRIYGRQAGRKSHRGKRRAAHEGIAPHFGALALLGKGDRGECSTSAERAVVNRHHACRNLDARKAGSGKRLSFDRRQRRGESHGGKTRAGIEGAMTDDRDALGNHDRRQRRAVIEGAIRKLGQRRGERHRGKRRAKLKGAILNCRPLGDHDRRQSATILEGIGTDLAQRGAERDGLKACASAERHTLDFCAGDTHVEDNLGQLRATIECIRTDRSDRKCHSAERRTLPKCTIPKLHSP